MTLLDTVRLALANLGQAKLRTALTVLGVSIGIASLSGMVSLGVGLEEQLVGRFTQSGMFDSITVTSSPFGRQGGAGARGRRGGAAARGAQAGGLAPAEPARPRLDDEAVARIGALPDVRSVHPNFRVPMQAAFKDYSEMTAAAGVPLSAAGEGVFRSLAHGAFFANEQDDACLISLDLAKRLSDQDPKELVGQAITLTYAIAAQAGTAAGAPSAAGGLAGIGAAMQVQRVDMRCPIVGIVEREYTPGLAGGGVGSLMIPLARARAIDAVQVTSAQALLRRSTEPRDYGAVTVKVASPMRTQDVQDRIKAMGFSAFSLNDALQGAKRAFLILDIVLSLIGSIALAVSSLGIVNTMVMSILERTREIGIMKAIGGDDRDIRRIFLVEASVIGLLGGVAGVVLGWIVGRAVNFGANIYIERQGGTPGDVFSMPFWLIGGAIAFSVFVSLAAGSYPARRAARLDPIQALRHE